MDLKQFPKITVVDQATPLQELTRLRQTLGCKPRLFVKRDDTTTLGLGGNKNRKLQYIMAQAMQQQADTVITTGGVQSNHCRQTLAFANHLGMACHLVLMGDEPSVYQGNALLFKLLGATLHFIGKKGDATAEMAALAGHLRKAGNTPYVIPLGGSTPLGTLGYIEVVPELLAQAKAQGVSFQHCFVANGSCGTQAGLEIGSRTFCPSMKIHGISVNHTSNVHQRQLVKLVEETYGLLGITNKLQASDFVVHDQFVGEGYAIPTPAGDEAIHLCALTEGLLLDPVYTGKALAGLIHLLRQGALDDAEAILFVHTGGSPALFALAEHFQ